ncbi:MAG: tRNA (adenosine(37)-N6)-threonylcarbamoyltransferase complex dimerization subunit type 1 TsaB [Pseudomonadota bacterium]
MTNLLAIDSAGTHCSVGLELDGNRFQRSEHVERRHNERLLPLLEALLLEAGSSRREFLEKLDAVAFTRGPGSFTGGRIAAAAAQALALTAGCPVVRVSSSALLARTCFARRELAGVRTSIRSRRDLYYLAAYRNVEGLPHLEAADQLYSAMPERGILAADAPWPLVGEQPDWWRGQDGLPVIGDPGAMLDLAAALFEEGAAVDAAEGLPEYLEGDTPWRKSS